MHLDNKMDVTFHFGVTKQVARILCKPQGQEIVQFRIPFLESYPGF